MAKRFSSFNQPVKCVSCGAMTTQSVGGITGLDMCKRCQDAAGLEIEHKDYGHQENVDGCPVCCGSSEDVMPTGEAWDKALTESARRERAGENWEPSERPYRVSRSYSTSAPGCYGWNSATVTVASLDEALRLAGSALAVRGTRHVHVDVAVSSDDWSTWSWNEVKKMTPARASGTKATRQQVRSLCRSADELEHRVASGDRGGAIDLRVQVRGDVYVVVWTVNGGRGWRKPWTSAPMTREEATAFASKKWAVLVDWLTTLQPAEAA